MAIGWESVQLCAGLMMSLVLLLSDPLLSAVHGLRAPRAVGKARSCCVHACHRAVIRRSLSPALLTDDNSQAVLML